MQVSSYSLTITSMFATIILVGRLAQWLERCVDIAEVTGSSPVSPICKVKQEYNIIYNFQAAVIFTYGGRL